VCGAYDVRPKFSEYEYVEGWEIYSPHDHLLVMRETQEWAISETKALAQAQRIRATWHDRGGHLMGEVDYSTVFSRRAEPNAGAIEDVLKDGYRLFADCSGSGLRVVSVERKFAAVGGKKERTEVLAVEKHYSLEVALAWVEEDLVKGQGKPRRKVTVKGRTAYWSGSTRATSHLDEWIMQGRQMEVWAEGDINSPDEIVVCLSGLMVEGRGGKDPVQEREEVIFGTLTKTGRGQDFFEASQRAIEDPGVFVGREVIKQPENAVTL
jgi:hypothetical protein